ncbi:MAG: putative sugar nucleotidyl transferase [Pirellulaceae bacterium]
MRLILLDQPSEKRHHFYPLALCRPIWELRCGMTTLAEKLVAQTRLSDVACFVPSYMADVYAATTSWPVNDLTRLAGDDLLVINPRVKAAGVADAAQAGPSTAFYAADGELLCARIARGDLPKLNLESVETFVASIAAVVPNAGRELPAWGYIWELVLENPEHLTRDFQTAGRNGIEGTVEEPYAIRGSRSDVYIAPGVTVHPMVVIDCEHGPVYIDEGAEIHPFTRIEGPCYIGRKSILLGAKCREGNSIGPMCRVGGEVEESIIQGYSNKYHDGFLGHAYVGEWVNLGALTTNSDLKNDYSSVEVTLDGHTPIDTGSTKVGSLIGDHTKTSIGTLLNTGAFVGSMALIAATGKPLPKYIPSFAWFLEGVVTKGFGKKKLFQTAATAMGRRKLAWTPELEVMWNTIFELTAPTRNEAIKKGRRVLAGRQS